MEHYVDAGWYQPTPPPAPRRRGRKWLLIGGLALAFTLALGIGTLLGSVIPRVAQAANLTPGSRLFALASTPGTSGAHGARGQCGTLTVSSVNGQMITATAPDGSTVTIHTTASTKYTRSGQSVSASAVTAGSQIDADGTRNSDGSITATSIDIR
jgi:hypothetical protein